MHRIGNHLRAHFIAYLALFFALGGTSIAAVQALPPNSVGARQLKKNAVTNPKLKNNAVTGPKVKNNSLTGSDVAESTLGKVPSAANADHATAADTATNATQLGGQPATAYAPTGAEAVRVIGASGQPAFGPGWGFGGITTEEVPGFWKDPAGTVHLRGAAGRLTGTGTVMFTLPAGYRPKLQQWFITYGSGLTQAYVSVESNGDVVYQGGRDASGVFDNSNYVGLGNITFRADQ